MAPHGSSAQDGTQGGRCEFFAAASRQPKLPRNSNQFMPLCRRDTLVKDFRQRLSHLAERGEPQAA
jgi:hypothetical protein